MTRRSPVVGEEPQGYEVAVVVDRDLNGAPGPKLVQGTRRGVRAQVLHGLGVVDAGAREQAAQRVAALDALFPPVRCPFIVVLDDGPRQHALDDARGHRFQDGVGRRSKRGHRGQAQDGERDVLPGVGGRALRRLR